MKRYRLAILDIDDTLFDWLSMWRTSRTELLSNVEVATGLPAELVRAHVRDFHKHVRTSEHPYSAADLMGMFPSLNEESAVNAAQKVQDLELRLHALFPGITELIQGLAAQGVVVVLHTDAPTRIAERRVERLGISKLVTCTYSRSDGSSVSDPSRHVPLHHAKPSVLALNEILERNSVPAEEALYVGDSLYRDIAMAQRAGVRDIFAAYGCRRDSGDYFLLQALSHWTDEDIEEEKRIRSAGELRPSEIANTPADLAQILGF